MITIIWFIVAIAIGTILSAMLEAWFDLEVSTFLIVLVVWCFLPGGCDTDVDMNKVDKQLTTMTTELQEKVDTLDKDSVIKALKHKVILLEKEVDEFLIEEDKLMQQEVEADARAIKENRGTQDAIQATVPVPTGINQQEYRHDPYDYSNR